jgi:spermidine synthase
MGKIAPYFYEECSPNYVRGFKIDRLLFDGKTKYQHVKCIENEMFGKVLFLDEKIQSAQVDERIYHETLVHPVMVSHPHPQKVLVVGGGEGATIREVLKHSTVTEVTMVDIDEELVQICRQHLPEWSEGAFDNLKTKLIFDDARTYCFETDEKYDIVISDLTEPLEGSSSRYLFTKEFFARIFEILSDEGIFVLQAGSTDPYYYEFFGSCVKTLETIFSNVQPFWAFVFSFGFPWGFVLGTQSENQDHLTEKDIAARWKERGIPELEFYRPSLHAALFTLPVYLEKGIERGRILADKEPYVWKI